MYTILRAESMEETLALAQKEENRAYINKETWNHIMPNASKPLTWAVVTHSDDRFFVVMRSYETELRREIHENWGKVFTDSCMEFFFSPCPKIRCNYFNMEVSASGALHIKYGKQRYYRRRANEDISLYNLKVEITDTYWQSIYEIPYSVIREKAHEFEGKSGDVISGNFYKCGDMAKYPHWLLWNEPDIKDCPYPEFHFPEGFGDIIIA